MDLYYLAAIASVLGYCGKTLQWRQDNVTTYLAVFAPVNNSLPFSLNKVRVFIERAETKLEHYLHPRVKLRFRYIDSKYPEETPAEIEAIKFLFKETNNTHAFLGPVSDIALSHVARISATQRIPILSPGGMNIHFGLNKTEHKKYETFIRMQYNFNKLTNFLLHIFYYKDFRFKRVKVLAEKHDTLLDSCNSFHAAVDYIFNNFKKKLGHRDFVFDNFMLPRQFNITHVFLSEISTEYAGKWPTDIRGYSDSVCLDGFYQLGSLNATLSQAHARILLLPDIVTFSKKYFMLSKVHIDKGSACIP